MFSTKGNCVSNMAPGTHNKLLKIRVKSYIGASRVAGSGGGEPNLVFVLLLFVLLSKIFVFDETILVL